MNLSRRTVLRLLAAGPLLLAGCSRQPHDGDPDQLQRSFFCFDTACVIGGVMDSALLDRLVERCQGFEQTLSRTIPTSDVGRINAAGGAMVEVDPQTADLIAQALDFCRASGGLFDITIGAVSELWDFHEGVVPTDEQIAQALPHVGYERVQVEGSSVCLQDPDARIDLGGIAKGYVADVLVDEMGDAGVESGFVNLGGNVMVVGAKPDGTPWNVGVRDPLPDAQEGASIARVAVQSASVVTSGLYERQFERNGRRYWHILDPQTGYPVESDLVSASIVSKRSIDGDGYTKPLFMLGAKGAMEWASQHTELKVLVVGEDGSLRMSPEDSFEALS